MLRTLSNILNHNIFKSFGIKKCDNFTCKTRSISYQSTDIWKSVLSVSTQGSKKGRGKRRGGSKSKDLNLGQNIGDGKLQIQWPGLNSDIINRNNELSSFKIIGEDLNREKKLTEIRNQMDKFKKMSTPPHERGFTSSSLNGKSIGPPLSYDDVDFSEFDTRVIEYKMMIAHKSILGKKKIASCFVVTGNKNGILGYGLGKGPTTNGAMKLAKTHASKRLLAIERCENRTLYHSFYEEFYFTKVYAEKMPKGYGLVCHRIIKKICELVGIKDLYAKVEAGNNPQNVAKAFITGLLNQKKYSDISNKKSLHLVEYKPESSVYPVILASPIGQNIEQKKQENENLEKESDITKHIFGNKCRKEKKKSLPFYHFFPSYQSYCKNKKKEHDQKRSKIQRVKLLKEENSYPKKSKKNAQL